MSSFAAGHVGGRGTWISGQQSSESTTLSPTKKSKPATVSISPAKTWQNRMATMKQGDFGNLTVASSATAGFKYTPHSPSSSPPRTPVSRNPVVDWDTVKSPSHTSPKDKDHHHHHHPNEGITKCICNRNFTMITCLTCGNTGIEGRVRTPCPRHPNTIHLMDIDRCPVCRATNLTEGMGIGGGVHHARPH